MSRQTQSMKLRRAGKIKTEQVFMHPVDLKRNATKEDVVQKTNCRNWKQARKKLKVMQRKVR